MGWRVYPVVLSLWLASACNLLNPAHDAADEPSSVSATLGPEGGSLELAGARLVLPQGALETEVLVTLRRGLEVPAEQEAVSEVFLIQPADFSLAMPARVEIALGADAGSQEDLAMFTVDALGSKNLGAEATEGGLAADVETLGVVFAGRKNPCGRLIQDDVNNCGSCGRSCNNNSGVVSCREGICEIDCDAEHGDCDEDADNGCETTTRENSENCGGCGIQCSEFATCQFDGDQSFCACAEGYEGDGITCTEITECEPGFALEGEVCVDIDECADGTDSCSDDASCTNTVGSYECQCNDGFESAVGEPREGVRCDDIDECATGTHDCASVAICSNTPGGFSCACPEGYRGDGRTCEDVDECAEQSDTCAENATCENTPGGFTCTCEPGYQGDGTSCTDIDECALGTDTCDDAAICSNHPGSFSCACKAGFEGNGLVCEDVDECALGTDTCSDDGVCSNTPGAYECECTSGFAGDGVTCEDIDECSDGSHSCSPNADCENQRGTFSCECRAGFVGDGQSCTDVDECADAGRCHADASCSNEPGGFSCTCNPGFVGDGQSCEDVDECQEVDICGNFGVCANSIGSFDCSCEDGYERIGDACVDIDECLTEVCGDNAHCENSSGSFSCLCNEGFVGDGHTCNDAAQRAVLVEAGGAHTCALFDNNLVRCWGWGIYGELGHGNTDDIGVDNEPVDAPYVELGGTVRDLDLGVTHTCAIMSDDSLRCWGRNFYGPLGLGTSDDLGDDELPTAAPAALQGMPVSQVAGGGEHTCALDPVGNVYCWGLSIDGQLGYGRIEPLGDDEDPLSEGSVELLGQARQVVAGRDHSCALLESGQVQCWGRGEHSPLGYGHVESIGDDEGPNDAGVVDVGGVVQELAAGWYHTCALLETGTVRCWGYGNLGALGYASRETVGDDEVPASLGDIDVGGPVQQIVAGTYHTCALLENGRVRCWGFGGDGQLGYGNTQTIGDDEHPFEAGDVDVGGRVTQITAGSFHTCALLETGNVRCWGAREHGQLCYQGTENVGDDERPSTMGDCPILPAVCPAGFALAEDGVSCEDIDECALGIDACSELASCTNTEGGYECACDEGYEGDGFTCDDINECEEQTDDCSENADCINTDGGFTCECHAGYFGDGVTCGGACETGNDECDENAECTDGEGSYTCSCLPGFAGDGFTCTDIDECALGIDTCDANAGCINTPGAYECVCHETFVGDGESCECPEGYEDIGGSCGDINECSRGLDDCADDELCLNTDGGFDCIGPSEPGDPEDPEEPLECPEGFELLGTEEFSVAGSSVSGFAAVVSESGNNDTKASAQRLSGEVTVKGEVDLASDALDVYRVQLAPGQGVSLFIEEDGARSDLDLHVLTTAGAPVHAADGSELRSRSTSRFESLAIEVGGTYLVVVEAVAGASRYSLVVGPTLGKPLGNAPKPRFVPGEVIVRFDPRANVALNVPTVAQGMGASVVSGSSSRAVLMRQSANSIATTAALGSGLDIPKDAVSLAKEWARRPDVLSATPNYLYEPTFVPNDEFYGKQWHYETIRLPEAWEVVPDASDVIVAVIDTGIILAHPDLDDVLVPGYDFIRDPSRARDGDGIDPDADDVGDSATPGASSYHGTHVAGTVSAETNNSIGVAGVGQGARIMPLRALGAGGGSSYDIMQSIRFAAGLPNDSGTVPAQRADVINMSLGGAGRDPSFEALIAEVRSLGVVVVAAAGNDSTSALAYPASYEGVISVSATDFESNLSYYSNFGGAIDVAAPGGDVRVDKNGDGLADGVFSTLGSDSANGIVPSYKFYQGTSMAAPHMAGVVALMMAANSELGPEDIDALLASGTITTDLGTPGRDNSYGYGLINAEDAVLRAQEFVAGAPAEEQPYLVATPTSLSFLDPAVTEESLVLRNSGQGELVIDPPAVDAPWLSFGPLVDAEGEHQYQVVVARDGLEVGSYSATITVSSSVNTVQIPVVMEVQAPQCVDINECELELDNCATPEENGDCRNLPGTFECFCFDGYEGDGVTCTDIDECEEGTDTCSEFATCTNTEPGYTCECLPGFEGDGEECLPPNECELGLDNCDENATCTDTFEGFTCECNDGYEGDGVTCSDVDECRDGTHSCDVNAFCSNTEGAFECTCSPHFAGDGSTCAPEEGCISLENFEDGWPTAPWQEPLGGDLAGAAVSAAARTGLLGLADFSGVGLYSETSLGETQDSVGGWVRLGDVGATAGLAFGSSEQGGSFVQVDGSGALGLYQWSRTGEPLLVAETLAAIPVGEWIYLDVFFHGDGEVSASVLDETGLSSLAGVTGSVSPDSIGNPGLVANGLSDADGLVACALKPLVDECALGIDECDENAACTDLLGGYECECNPSFVGDGFTCEDENECETGNNSCSPNAICTDRVGGYDCACAEGFVGDGFLCTDIDECELGLDTCDENATCENTPGAYNCICDAGYEGDGFTCTDIDECALEIDSCDENAVCINTPGAYDCACGEGFEGDGFTCADIDECALGLDSCHDAATCTNAFGSYTCACNGGYEGDGFECFDVDECALGTDVCDELAECTNTEGFYVCSCPDGFGGDGFACADVDECSAGTHDCNELAECTNTPGSFTCECAPGYQGNGRTCSDIDECSAGTHTCSADGICTNSEGSFECSCAPGFEGTGFVCEDVDECAVGTDECSARALCSNTIGAYACDCRDGFEGDGFECLDVDECATGDFTCPEDSTCSNTEGGFDCTCKRGYELSEAGECKDVAEVAVQIGAGDTHTCALMKEGVVKCWGSGSNGRTGHGSTVTIGDTEIAGSGGILDISELAAELLAVGGDHSCVILSDGTVSCWGLGQDGRLGHDDEEDIGDDEHPSDVGIVPNLDSVVDLALGQKHSCALIDDGSVTCWGDNDFGQLGAGFVPAPIRRNNAVDLGGTAIAIAAGDYHTCALLDDGAVVCWGLGSFGRLGYGNSNAVGVSDTPADVGPVALGGSAIAIAAGAHHSCALLSDRSLRCWGRGLFGALGTGVPGNIGDDEVPADVPAVDLGAKPNSVTAGGAHTCVSYETGGVQCFGLASDGQLGYGNEDNIGDNEAPSLAGLVDLGVDIAEVDAGALHTCAVSTAGAVYCWGAGSQGQLGYGDTRDIGDSETPASAGAVPVVK